MLYNYCSSLEGYLWNFIAFGVNFGGGSLFMYKNIDNNEMHRIKTGMNRFW